MFTADNFQYALENTRLVLAPRQRIATFGQTRFHYHLLTESMDRVHEVRIRQGTICAERPQLLTLNHHVRLILENFGEQAMEFADWLRQAGPPCAALLKYGFQFSRTAVQEHIIREPMEEVSARVVAEVSARQETDPLNAVLQGVDDAWEVCLLKLTMDLVQNSSQSHFGEFRQRGLI